MEAYRIILFIEHHGTPWKPFFLHRMPQTLLEKEFLFSFFSKPV